MAYKEAHLCQYSLIWVLTFIEPCTDEGEIKEYCLWATRYVLRIVILPPLNDDCIHIFVHKYDLYWLLERKKNLLLLFVYLFVDLL